MRTEKVALAGELMVVFEMSDGRERDGISNVSRKERIQLLKNMNRIRKRVGRVPMKEELVCGFPEKET